MSIVYAAIYCWIFAIGQVTGQFWLSLVAVVSALVLLGAFRFAARLKTFTLLISSFTVLLAVRTQVAINYPASLDIFADLRSQVISGIASVNRDAAALVLGMTIGDTSLVTTDLKTSMQLTSLTHLMAVSGANCAIVVGAVYFLLFRFSVRSRVFISLVALLGYLMLVGAQPSVLRASAMSAAVLFAMLLGRKVNPLAALALSIMVLLVIAPEMATSYGFVLSVLSTAGILIAAPRLYQLLSAKLPNWVAMALSISATAQLFCFPVLLQLQGGVPTYSLLANLICEPLVAPITVIGLLAVCFIWLAPASAALFWLASLPAWVVAQTAHTLSSWPLATMPWSVDGWGLAGALILVGAILALLFATKSWIKNIAAVTAAILACCSFGVVLNQAIRVAMWPDSNWQVASCDVGQGDATVIRSHSAIAVIDVGRDDKKIDTCLSKLGVQHIDLLVLTHFDADHVAGLSGAIRNRNVGRAMLTSFVDDRPGANFSRFQLTAAGIPIATAETGLHGMLDQVFWKVLSPSRTASEAEDSNDGSITMLWQFSDFSLITLADLGEKGQMRLAESLTTWQDQFEVEHPLVMKVSHHGSADQYPEFVEGLHPQLALISVGKHNGYGHPTSRTLATLNRAGSTILRTDLLGSISVSRIDGQFEVSYSGPS